MFSRLFPRILSEKLKNLLPKWHFRVPGCSIFTNTVFCLQLFYQKSICLNQKLLLLPPVCLGGGIGRPAGRQARWKSSLNVLCLCSL